MILRSLKYIVMKFRNYSYSVCIIFFTLICLIYISYKPIFTNKPSFVNQNVILFFCMLVINILIFISINKISKILLGCHEKKVITFSMLISVFFQLIYIFLFPLNQHADAEIVFNCAVKISNGDFSNFNFGEYLSYYPNNAGISLVYAFLFLFLPKSYLTLRIFNIIFTTITAYIIYKISVELNLSKKITYGILISTIIFLPAIIMNNFTYGDTPAACFCTIAVYYALKYKNSSTIKYMYLSIYFLIIGYFFRQTTLLFLIAIFIYWFVNILINRKEHLIKLFLSLIVSVILLNFPINILSLIGTQSGILDSNIGQCKNSYWRWLNMGFPITEQVGYWDKGRNARLFKNKFNYNKEKSEIYFKNDTLTKALNTNTKIILTGYVKKTFWLWGEGTYQVGQYGFEYRIKNDTYYLYKTPVVSLAKNGGIFKGLLTLYLKTLNWLILILISFALFYSILKKNYRFELFVYIILVTIGFYLLWEIKSRYLFHLYPFEIIVSYYALNSILELNIEFRVNKNQIKFYLLQFVERIKL